MIESDIDKLSKLVANYKSQITDYDSIEIRCWNKEEASMLRSWLTNNHPDVPAKFTWLEF